MVTRVETPPPAYSSGENSPRGPEPIPGREETLLLGENQIAGGNLLEYVKRLEALSGGLDRSYAGSGGGEIAGLRATPSLFGPQPEPFGGGDRAAPPRGICGDPLPGHGSRGPLNQDPENLGILVTVPPGDVEMTENEETGEEAAGGIVFNFPPLPCLFSAPQGAVFIDVDASKDEDNDTTKNLLQIEFKEFGMEEDSMCMPACLLSSEGKQGGVKSPTKKTHPLSESESAENLPTKKVETEFPEIPSPPQIPPVVQSWDGWYALRMLVMLNL